VGTIKIASAQAGSALMGWARPSQPGPATGPSQ